MRISTTAFVSLSLFLLSSCASTHKGKSGTIDAAVSELRGDDGSLRRDIDLNEDGQAEITNYYRARRDAPDMLLRKELDLNQDGKVDVISHLDDHGNLAREDIDSDYDGRFDWTDHYQNGARVMSEYDTDYDGRPNVLKYYVRGEDGVPYIERKERDEDGDGKIDVWERFNRDGEVTRTGRDTNGDGRIDVREE